MNNKIIINATALNSSGALSILKQFIDSIPNDNFEYLIFVNNKAEALKKKSNVKYIPSNIRSFRRRFLWDAFGLKRWLKKNGIMPIATISMQNTNFRTYESVPNFIYYHQAIPFFDSTWNPFVSFERELWFYKSIYPFFVKLFINDSTEIFVQTNSIKDGFAKYFDFSKDKIHIISPRIDLPTNKEANYTILESSRLHLFYPATPYVYKNHKIIIKALSLLDINLQKKITLHLTCNEHDLKYNLSQVKSFFQMDFMGVIPYNKVLEMYEVVDALIFPSYIETIGLPIIEAASYGLPIIVSDMSYSREVLKNYEGVRFATYDDPQIWKEEISKLFSLKGQRYVPIKIEKSNSWPELFRILNIKIQ